MLATLLDAQRGEPVPFPASLTARYGGPLAFEREGRPRVIANFVSTIDGVTSFAIPGKADAGRVSAGLPADRFVLGLLRAVADAVVVGAGTLREEGRHVWTPAHVFPDAAADFDAVRRGRRPAPTVFVTASGDIDLTAPVFVSGDEVLILTTDAGAQRLARVPRHVRVISAGPSRLVASDIVRVVHDETGAELILTEGGPTLLGEFVRARALDELFLTIAPQLAGRSERERRLALVEGAAFAPEEAPWWRLLSVKKADEYLFLRFAYARTR